MKNNDHENAYKHYKKALNIEANSISYGRMYEYHLQRNEFIEAWPYLYKAASITPNYVNSTNFVSIYVTEIMPKYKIDSWSLTTRETRLALGEPTNIARIGSVLVYQYGLVLLEFQNDILSNQYWIVRPTVDPKVEPLVNYLPVWRAK